MKKRIHKTFFIFLFCMTPWLNTQAENPKTLGYQDHMAERKPIYSNNIKYTQTGNFHDALVSMINLEKGYEHYTTLNFDVKEGAYEINVILACSDGFEINLSSNHSSFEFKALYPSVTIPESVTTRFENEGRVYGIHDKGVYVYTIKGVAMGNQRYTVSLACNLDINGYPWDYYYENEYRDRPVGWLVDPITSRDIYFDFNGGKELSADLIFISTDPRKIECVFWPPISLSNWNFTLHDISKKGDFIVTPSYQHSESQNLNTQHLVKAGIYKYHVSATGSSSSKWTVRATAGGYTADSESGYYTPKVPYFDRTNYSPGDGEDGEDGEGVPVIFSYDAMGNRTKRELVLPPKSALAQSNEVDFLFDNVAKRDIKIYPNPTYGQLTVELSDIEGIEKGNITIYNFNGDFVLKKKIDLNRIDLDISNSPSGIYFMHIQIDGEATSWKIIKK